MNFKKIRETDFDKRKSKPEVNSSLFTFWPEVNKLPALRFSFSSNSDSRKALRSMAALSRASKSSKDAMVLLWKKDNYTNI